MKVRSRRLSYAVRGQVPTVVSGMRCQGPEAEPRDDRSYVLEEPPSSARRVQMEAIRIDGVMPDLLGMHSITPTVRTPSMN